MPGENSAPREDLVIGRNAVIELLRSDMPVEAVYLQKGLTGTILKIAAMAREKGIAVKDASPTRLDGMCSRANHQGAAAITAGARYAELEDIFTRAGESPLFVVLADGIEDPHNLGALIRTAEAAGAHGLIIPARRSAGLTFSAVKASAGAAMHLPVVKVTNMAETVENLKKRGVWMYAADMEGKSWSETDFSGPAGLVVGSEGRGVGRLVKERCDFTVSLPMYGMVGSLNVSVAAGIIMYEIARQRAPRR